MGHAIRKTDTGQCLFRPSARPRVPGKFQRQHDVFQRVQRRHEMERLEHEADALGPHAGTAVLVEFAEVRRHTVRVGVEAVQLLRELPEPLEEELVSSGLGLKRLALFVLVGFGVGAAGLLVGAITGVATLVEASDLEGFVFGEHFGQDSFDADLAGKV